MRGDVPRRDQPHFGRVGAALWGADLQLAEELARRAAFAMDNARLYEEAQREISERRLAQEELRESRDQLEAVLAGAAEGITAQDPSGKVIYANEAAARLTGFSSVQEVTTSTPADILARYEILDEEGAPFPSIASRAQGHRGRGRGRGSNTLSHPGHRRRAMDHSQGYAHLRGAGTVRMAVNILRDITESKRAEESLRRVTEAERRRIARDLHDGVLQDLSYTAAAIGMIMLQADERY